MDPIRLILVLGLVAHKLVWEMLKRPGGQPAPAQPPRSLGVRAVKLVKALALAGLVVQTLFLDLAPILPQPGPLRVFGLGLYLLGLSIAILGRLQLGSNWANLEDYGVLTEQALVTRGIYRYIRHPIYTGDLLLLLGLELALNSWLALGVVVVLAVVVRQTQAEENVLAQAFPGYPTYAQQTKRFIPFVV